VKPSLLVRAARGGFQRHRSPIAWGLVDQSCSSVTNFGLSLVAGRLLGPDGLGRVFLGFSVYLVIVNLQRRLITEPLLSASSHLAPQERSRTTPLGLTACMCLGSLSTAGVLMIGAILGGFVGEALFLIAPWILPTLVQDYWRNVLFRDKRASAAAANDGAWLVFMALALPALSLWRSDWAVMSWWGAGAVVGAVWGFIQTGAIPSLPLRAWAWFRKSAWPFGRWNAAAGIVASVGTQFGTFAVAGILGAAALGGLRAATTVFAPLTLITPALALPGLPAIARAEARGEGKRLAIGFSSLAVLASAIFSLFLVLGGWQILTLLFGASFARFHSLLWPIAANQIFAAAEVGFLLLLKAQRRGGVLLLTQVLSTGLGLVLVITLSLEYGLAGAAWTGAIMAAVSTSLIAFAAMRPPGRATSQRAIEPAIFES
jgi:O-antigen/teichoic acid export membrane protein